MLNLPAPGKLPFDPGWFSERQYEHLLQVIASPGGNELLVSLYHAVKARVDKCQDCQLAPGHTIRHVMACTRGGHPGINEADLLPVTRGMLSAIFEELPE
jgi:hypothetical protein